jgi:hypothetical protein
MVPVCRLLRVCVFALGGLLHPSHVPPSLVIAAHSARPLSSSTSPAPVIATPPNTAIPPLAQPQTPAPVPAPVQPTTSPALVTATVRAEWQRTSVCETGGNWAMHGPVYGGGIGMSDVNWSAYSAGLGYPATEGTATPTQQIIVAERVQAAAGVPGYVPDQFGCGTGW